MRTSAEEARVWSSLVPDPDEKAAIQPDGAGTEEAVAREVCAISTASCEPFTVGSCAGMTGVCSGGSGRISSGGSGCVEGTVSKLRGVSTSLSANENPADQHHENAWHQFLYQLLGDEHLDHDLELGLQVVLSQNHQPRATVVELSPLLH